MGGGEVFCLYNGENVSWWYDVGSSGTVASKFLLKSSNRLGSNIAFCQLEAAAKRVDTNTRKRLRKCCIPYQLGRIAVSYLANYTC